MGVWFSGGGLIQERQCGPHPGTSRIPCSKFKPSTKYWITIKRTGSNGYMKVYNVQKDHFQVGDLVAYSSYKHIASYSGATALGEAHHGRERFNGKIYCLRDTLPPGAEKAPVKQKS